MKKLSVLLFLLFTISAFSQENLAKLEWNGYTQLRASSNFIDNNSFSLRRLKLWMKSSPEFSEHWSYKVQATISSIAQEKFFLQDVKIAYTLGLFSVDFGQFVPEYSLQRFQSDYSLSTIERAKAIDALIPSGMLGVRDIGIQANLHSKNKRIQTHFGIFNGYGIKEYRFQNQGYMLSHKTTLDIPLNQNKFQIGYSLQYRYAQNLEIPKVLPDSFLYTGNDFRSNIFVHFQARFFELQAEYLNANFEGEKAEGFYFLSTLNVNKNQFVFSYEKYADLIEETTDKPYYRLAYNYLINKNKIKLHFDNFFQINEGEIENYIASIQMQVFFK